MLVKRVYFILIIYLAPLWISTAIAQEVDKFDFERIEDNSFLIEEAYNQEPGVIQHISNFQLMNDGTWLFTFTDEWPVPGRKHQLSATIAVLRSGVEGFGDMQLNYRYQAIFTNRFAFSPRFSLVIPSGNYKNGLGSGAPGYQFSLPFSFLLSRKVVTHYNLGLTIIPNAKKEDGSKSDIFAFSYGMSTILLLSEHINFMFEVVGNSTYSKSDNEKEQIFRALIINPGLRYAINCKSGLQIVPGIAAPIGLSSSSGRSGIFIYLSFEHPLWKPR
jgi:hypothetical protein